MNENTLVILAFLVVIGAIQLGHFYIELIRDIS